MILCGWHDVAMDNIHTLINKPQKHHTLCVVASSALASASVPWEKKPPIQQARIEVLGTQKFSSLFDGVPELLTNPSVKSIARFMHCHDFFLFFFFGLFLLLSFPFIQPVSSTLLPKKVLCVMTTLPVTNVMSYLPDNDIEIDWALNTK